MMKASQRFSTRWGARPASFLVVWLVAAAFCASAEVRFDMFPGFGSALAHRAWNPVVFELENDGETIDATIEIFSDHAETRTRVAVELPPNTTKRLVVPMYVFQSYPAGWSATLLDERGRKIAENRPSGLLIVPEMTPLVVTLPDSPAGGPRFPTPTMDNGQAVLTPAIREAQVALFPDSALPLGGVDTVYLHSGRAVELEPNQVNALLSWLNGGGHLVVAVDQPQDLLGAEWLGRVFPLSVGDTSTTASTEGVFHGWNQTRIASELQPFDHRLEDFQGEEYDPAAPDTGFEDAEFLYWPSEIRDGEALLSTEDGAPLAVRATRGRGTLTALSFSPELEPFRSWSATPWMWTGVLGVSSDWFHPSRSGENNGAFGFNARSLDNAMGTMIDSRQVKKLPIGWLVAMLVIYLVVIGPGDYFLLKRLRRPMLTWITFPLYVAVFSGLIYYIGYRLRAGEIEWNETHIVDVLPRGSVTDHHGWMFQSIYSPLNRNYALELDDRVGGVRAEVSAFGPNASSGRLTTNREGRGFNAQAFVPVWTSRLIAGQWHGEASPALEGNATRSGDSVRIQVENRSPAGFRAVWVAYGDQVYSLGALRAGQTGDWTLGAALNPESIDSFVSSKESRFHRAAMQRDQALGSTAGAQVERSPANYVASSFFDYDAFREAGRRRPLPEGMSQDAMRANLTKLELFAPLLGSNGNNRIHSSRGYDLSRELFRGHAVVFALSDERHSVPPIAQFSPARQTRETMYRLILPTDGNRPL